MSPSGKSTTHCRHPNCYDGNLAHTCLSGTVIVRSKTTLSGRSDRQSDDPKAVEAQRSLNWAWPWHRWCDARRHSFAQAAATSGAAFTSRCRPSA